MIPEAPDGTWTVLAEGRCFAGSTKESDVTEFDVRFLDRDGYEINRSLVVLGEDQAMPPVVLHSAMRRKTLALRKQAS